MPSPSKRAERPSLDLQRAGQLFCGGAGHRFWSAAWQYRCIEENGAWWVILALTALWCGCSLVGFLVHSVVKYRAWVRGLSGSGDDGAGGCGSRYPYAEVRR